MSSSSSDSENLPRASEKELDVIRRTLNPPEPHRADVPAPARPLTLPSTFMRAYNTEGIREMIRVYVKLVSSETGYQKRTRRSTLWRELLEIDEHEIVAIDQLAMADQNLSTAISQSQMVDTTLKYQLSFPKNRSRMFAFMIALYYCSWKRNISLEEALDGYKKLSSRRRAELARASRDQTRDSSPTPRRKMNLVCNAQNEEIMRLRAEVSRLETEIFTLKNHQVAVAARTPKKVRKQ